MRETIDPALVYGWLRARSVARGLPAPVAEHGGWRVETGLATEIRRYVFAQETAGLRRLAEEISQPKTALKLCGAESELKKILPEKWQIQSVGYMMTCDDPPDFVRKLPPDYRSDMSRYGSVTTVTIRSADGDIAASGYAAEINGTFAYDRIVTDNTHQRRGLGSVVMALLKSAKLNSAATEVLVATPQGRALYERLGWLVVSPLTTATIP